MNPKLMLKVAKGEFSRHVVNFWAHDRLKACVGEISFSTRFACEMPVTVISNTLKIGFHLMLLHAAEFKVCRQQGWKQTCFPSSFFFVIESLFSWCSKNKNSMMETPSKQVIHVHLKTQSGKKYQENQNQNTRHWVLLPVMILCTHHKEDQWKKLHI